MDAIRRSIQRLARLPRAIQTARRATAQSFADYCWDYYWLWAPSDANLPRKTEGSIWSAACHE
jgi:hypothetical protein